jgi:preprotein translocase subunit YajC
MKKLLILSLTAIFFAGCGMLTAKKTEENKTVEAAETKDEAKIKTGDTVVAKWSSGSFYEGKVESVSDTKIKVAWLDKSNPSDVDAIDVYALPKAGAKPDVKVGDMVLAKTSGTGTYWNGAEVTSIDGDVYKVKPTSITSSLNVPAEKIIKVSSAVAADFKDKAGAKDFTVEAQKHKPLAAGDYKPKKGDRVVAEWTTNSWYSGKVEKYEEPNITIAWDDGSKPSPLNWSKVVPMPTAASNKEMPKKDQFLLIKPNSGTKWQYAQVSDVSGSNVEVKLAGDKTQTVKAGEFILLN